MNDARTPAAFRFASRVLAAPGSVAEDAFVEGAAAELFRAVIRPGAVPDESVSRSSHVGPDAFVATSPQARTKLETVLAGAGQFVTTGQQPGLFLGPLYTLYKTATAIRLAAELECSTGRPTLAAFWVVADDHDWDEIGACQVLSMDEALVELRLNPSQDALGRSVGQAVLPDSVTGLVERLGEITGIRTSGDDRAAFLEILGTAYRPGETMSGAFVATMARLFADHDLVLLDSSDPAIRTAAAGLYGEILSRPTDVTDAMTEGREQVRNAGYPIQLTPPESGMQIFFDDGADRQHILATPSGFAGGERNNWSPESLAALLDGQPAAFTPAAALRPVLESWLLPVAATVLGPGELAYWAQLGPLFGKLNVEMPAVAARDSWILVESRIDRLLRKLEVDEAVVEQDGTELRRQVLARGRPEGVSKSLTQLDREIQARFAEFESVGDAELPGLKSAVGKARHGMEKVLDDLHRVVDRRVAEHESTSMDQLDRIVANLTPAGSSQEHTLGAAAFLAKYGPELVDRLVETTHVAASLGQD